MRKIHLIFWSAAFSLLAYSCFEYWSHKNAPLYKKFEQQWQEDVDQLIASNKLPTAFYQIRDLTIVGGTPETRDWLQRIHAPLKTNPSGQYSMEVLIVAWEENGKRGTMVQYNIEDVKTKNNIWELGRTLILTQPSQQSDWFNSLKENLL